MEEEAFPQQPVLLMMCVYDEIQYAEKSVRAPPVRPMRIVPPFLVRGR